MQRALLTAACAALAAVALPAAANAANAATTTALNMRAGPGVTYPVVAAIPAGAPVQIYGCVRDGSWCDTRWVGERGWVAGAYLASIWRGALVPVATYAPRLGYPVVVYDRDVYWSRHYVGRPWYPRRQVFVGPSHRCYRGPLVTACR